MSNTASHLFKCFLYPQRLHQPLISAVPSLSFVTDNPTRASAVLYSPARSCRFATSLVCSITRCWTLTSFSLSAGADDRLQSTVVAAPFSTPRAPQPMSKGPDGHHLNSEYGRTAPTPSLGPRPQEFYHPRAASRPPVANTAPQ